MGMVGDSKRLLVGCLSAIGCEILYGLSYLFTKQATETASALSLLGWRFFIAFIAMGALAAVGLVKIRLKGKNLKPLLAVALFCPVAYFICETLGIGNTTASESGVFLACIPVVCLVASAIILRKKPTRLQVTGILVTLVGVIITVIAVGASASLSIVGYAFLATGVISYSLYCVFVERATGYSGMEITFIMLSAGAVVFPTLAICEAIAGGNIAQLATLPFNDAGFRTAILYQGIGCSILAFFLSNVAIARIGVNRTSSFVGVSTVVSVAAGSFFLGEQFTAFQGMGALIIVAGVCIANMKGTRV